MTKTFINRTHCSCTHCSPQICKSFKLPQLFNSNPPYIVEPKLYPKILSNIDDLDQLNFKELLQQGYTAIAFDQIPEETYIENLPLKIISIKDIKITRDNSIPLPPIEYGKKPTFTLTKNNELYYAIIDGNVYNFTKEGN